ncbi:MAG: non-ribosomal peptide synthetase, partial [Chloroflexi bacterium]
MKTQELLAQLVKLDIKLWIDGGRLRYNAPQGVMTTELLTELAKHKTEIIAHLQNFAHQNNINLPVMVSVPRSGSLPLSFAQQRLWFLDQFEPGSTSYNIPGAVRLIGELNEAALQQTVNEIVRRHEVLRTSFGMLDGSPVQVIAEKLEVP